MVAVVNAFDCYRRCSNGFSGLADRSSDSGCVAARFVLIDPDDETVAWMLRFDGLEHPELQISP